MSGSAPITAGAGAGAGSASWHIRHATTGDVAAAAAAVGELLRELGSMPPPLPAMETAARELLEDPRLGALLLVEGDGAIVGVLAASWQSAMHVPGRYALIQDLWVHRSWRSVGVGAGLLAALCELAREQGLARVEVGLPGERFSGLAATEAFYLANGFTPLGVRMRWGIA
ncbi:MAG: GNAT family N-acetyltransferase [Solirubrobacteraceae bacterium]